MASLRKTRRFSSSPIPQEPQEVPDHDPDSYDDSVVPEISTVPQLSYGSESLYARSNSRSESVRKAKDQFSAKYEGETHHLSRWLDRDVTCENSSFTIGPIERKKKQVKTTRNRSGLPKNLNDLSHAGNEVARTSAPVSEARASHLLAPKCKSMVQSRSPSPVASLSRFCAHEKEEDTVTGSWKSLPTEVLYSRTGSPSKDVVTRKLSSSSKPVGPSRNTFSPLPLTSNLKVADLDPSKSGPSSSLAVKSSSIGSSVPSSLPMRTRKATPSSSSDETYPRAPSREKSQFRTPQPSSLPVASQSGDTAASRTRADLIEGNRGKLPRRKQSRQPESPAQKLSPTVKSSAQMNHNIFARSKYGLALTTQSGHPLGEPSDEKSTPTTNKLRLARKATAELHMDSLSPQNALAKKTVIVGPGFSRNGVTSDINNCQKVQDSGTFPLKFPKTYQTAAILEPADNITICDGSQTRRYTRNQTLRQSNQHNGWRHGGSSDVDGLDVHRVPFSSRNSPNPTQSTSKPPRTEADSFQQINRSDIYSSSLPRPRKLMVRNPGPADSLSSLSSSNLDTPKSTPTVPSGDFTLYALSGSQTTLDQGNEVNYVVPDDVAAEVAMAEERRRKALAGLVHDLQLIDGEHDMQHQPHEYQGTMPSRESKNTVFAHRDHLRDDDGEEDDDAFFAKLTTSEDVESLESLLKEPEPEANAGFMDDYDEDGFSEGHSNFESGSEDGDDEDEYPRLPPTPTFVHPLDEGDDLESRITRVTSLNRISSTPPRSHSRGLARSQQPRSQPKSQQVPTPTSLRDVSLRSLSSDVPGPAENSWRGMYEAKAVDVHNRGPSLESAGRGEIDDPASVDNAQEDTVLSHDNILSTDNELSSVGDGRLSDGGSGTEETLSSGAVALFRQLQVETDAREASNVDESHSPPSTKTSHSQEATSHLPIEAGSSIEDAEQHLENGYLHEPCTTRTWRSTLPPGAYDSLAERHGPSEMRRQEIIWELCETEQAFVKSLRLTLRLFVQPLRHENKTWIPGVPRDVARLFDWFDDIMHLHSQMSSALHAARSSQYPVVIQIAETLRPFVPRLELHQPYLVRLESVSSAIEAMTKDEHSDFGEYIRIQTATPECASMNLPSYLLKPVQRLMKYPLFFKQLWELTPRNHPDHLPTFSLLHSTDMIIRVMQEIKTREEEYELVKNLASRIKGLPPGYQLARRERRLVAQGLLRRVILNNKERAALEIASEITSDVAEYQSSPTISTHRLTSESSQNSSSSGDWEYHPSSVGQSAGTTTHRSFHNESAVSDASFDSTSYLSKAASRSVSSLRGSLRHKSKESPVYAFVFTDLVILTTPLSEKIHLLRNSKNGNGSRETWKLMDGMGVSRVLGVSDQSGQLPHHKYLMAVELMSMTTNILNNDALPDGATAFPVYFTLPDQGGFPSEGICDALAEAKAKWLDAFERCFRFTLRSLSFPSYGKRDAGGGNLDLESDTKSSVMSILSSGLPLPMSPSQQLDEAQRGRPTDLIQEEREERGWWSLRFHQVLKEVQRSSRSPILDVAPSRKSDSRHKRQGGKRSEPRPLILSPNPSIIITPSRKSGLLSLGRKKSR